jgi:hypothetical protein
MDIGKLIVENRVPSRGYPNKDDLLKFAASKNISIQKKWKKDEIVNHIKELIEETYQPETESDKYTCKEVKGVLKAYKFDSHKNKYISIPLDELPAQMSKKPAGKKRLPIHPCFAKIPECKHSCREIIKNSSYPCRKNRTVFTSREEYLNYRDLITPGEYSVGEIIKRADEATEQLEALNMIEEFEPQKEFNPKIRIKSPSSSISPPKRSPSVGPLSPKKGILKHSSKVQSPKVKKMKTLIKPGSVLFT